MSLPYDNAARRPPTVTLSVPAGWVVEVTYTGPATKGGTGRLSVG